MLLLIFIIPLLIVSSKAVDPIDRFPTFWSEAPSFLSDYPLVNNCSSSQTTTAINSPCRLIDPWQYLDRLGLYKILINVTTPFMRFCKPSQSNPCNILFVLAVQLGWEFDSYRLFTNGTTQISVNSWWASLNYYLSVIPFLAAADIGFLPRDTFQFVQRDDFCLNSAQCLNQTRNAMLAWRHFYVSLLQSSSCYACANCDVREECYLADLWSAYNASVNDALPIIESKLSLLPSHQEQQFALSWINVLTLIGMARTNSDLQETNSYQDMYLPNRMLTENDKPPNCEGLSETVNQALKLMFEVPIALYPAIRTQFYWVTMTDCDKSRRLARIALEIAPLSKIIATAYYELAGWELLVC